MYDDSRGLGEGVIDNKPTTTRMALVFEDRSPQSHAAPETRSAKKRKTLGSAVIPRASLLVHSISNSYSYPMDLWAVDASSSPPLRTSVRLLTKSFPCDVHLVALRSLPSNAAFELPSRSSLMIVHRQSYACEVSWTTDGSCSLTTDGRLAPGTKFKAVEINSVHRTTLTAVKDSEALASIADISVPALEIRAYNVTFA